MQEHIYIVHEVKLEIRFLNPTRENTDDFMNLPGS